MPSLLRDPCLWCSLQNLWVAKVWVWVPYDCYYHLYTRDDLYACAVRDNVGWIHSMGDSQEREFVSMYKQMNASWASFTKYQHVSRGGLSPPLLL